MAQMRGLSDYQQTFGDVLGKQLYDQMIQYVTGFTGSDARIAAEDYFFNYNRQLYFGVRLGEADLVGQAKAQAGLKPGGLQLRFDESQIKLVVAPGEKLHIVTTLYKFGIIDSWDNYWSKGFASGVSPIKLYSNNTLVAEVAGPTLDRMLTAPADAGLWVIKAEYREEVTDPVTRDNIIDTATPASFTIVVGPAAEVIVVPPPEPVITGRIGTYLKVLFSAVVNGVEKTFSITKYPTFVAGEAIKLVAFLSYQNKAVTNFPVIFIVDDTKIGKSRTDSSGYAAFPFKVPAFGEERKVIFTNPAGKSTTGTLYGTKRHNFCAMIQTEKDGPLMNCESIVVTSESVAGREEITYKTYLEELRGGITTGLESVTPVFQPSETTPTLPDLSTLLPSPITTIGPPDQSVIINIPAPPVPPGVTYPVEVEIDGERRGRPPLQVRTTPGKHTVKVSLKGFPPFTKTITLASGETITMSEIVFSRQGG